MKKGIIISLVVILLLGAAGGGFAFYWFNRPIYKVTKALDNDDINTAIDLFDKLSKDSEIEEVEGRFLDIAKSSMKDFEKEKISYKDLKKVFKQLNKAMGENDDYNEIVESAEALNDSREAFLKAEELFENEEYEEAIELFSKVIKDDSNYKAAKKRIDEAEELMVPQIVGVWSGNIDIGKLFGFEFGVNTLQLKMNLNFVFNEDGSGYMKFDDSNINELYKMMIEVYKKYLIEEFESYGYDEDDINELLSYSGFDSIEELCEEEISIDDFKEFTEESREFNYTFDDETFTLRYADDGTEEIFDYEMKDKNTLVILGTNISSASEMEEVGIEFPWELHRK